MSLEEELQQEIATITEWLSRSGSASFVQQLTRGQMERRLLMLRERLSDAVNRVLELHFENPDRPGFAALSSTVLSNLLTRIQGTLTYGTWAQTSGPNVAGTPPVSIERSALTEVVATPSGSFRLLLRKQELDMNPSFDRSVAMVFEIAGAAAANSLDDSTGLRAQELGRVATRRLELFFKKLGEENLDTEFTWRSPDSQAEVFVSHQVASELSRWLAVAVPDIEDIIVHGYLRRADTITGAFKIEDETTGRMYEGGGVNETLAHAEMDALYEATISIERRSAPHTGRVTEKLRLLDLRTIGANDS